MKLGSLAESRLTESQIARCLQRVSKTYRYGDASWFLYREMVRERWDYSSRDQIERLYAVLSSWGMNSRGAKLAPFKRLLASIKENERTLNALSKFKIEKVESFETPSLLSPMKSLFDSLAIVQKVKPKFVGFSKAIHFLLPDLIAPMDRQYTVRFFRGYSTALPKQEERQFDLFVEVMDTFFSRDYRLAIQECLSGELMEYQCLFGKLRVSGVVPIASKSVVHESFLQSGCAVEGEVRLVSTFDSHYP